MSLRVSYVSFIAAYLFIATVALFGAPVGGRSAGAASVALHGVLLTPAGR